MGNIYAKPKKEAPVDIAIRVLNEALKIDPVAVNALMMYRALWVNKKMGKHPTIQCGWHNTLTALGLINGLFGVNKDGRGHITAYLDDNTNRIIQFKKSRLLKDEPWRLEKKQKPRKPTK